MKIFTMVTTTETWEYTSYALKSFFRTCKPEGDERLFLIDNNGTFEEDTSLFSPFLEIIKNDAPLSFADNYNRIMKIASASQADFYILKNDLILTEDWLKPLLEVNNAMVSSVSNQQLHYERAGFVWKENVKLSDYLAMRVKFKEILEEHKSKSSGYEKVTSLPFYCIKIPHAVYEKVGLFDETLGSEDAVTQDYCLKVANAGFDLLLAPKSFVLHFNVAVKKN